MTDAPPKQVLLLRRDLKMPKGKIGAQSGHAAQCSLTKSNGAHVRQGVAGLELVVPLDSDDLAWLEGEYKKIVLGVDSEEELLQLHEAAKAAGLRTFLVQDNGHTVFNGQKTLTAVGIGPHDAARIDAITGHLRPL